MKKILKILNEIQDLEQSTDQSPHSEKYLGLIRFSLFVNGSGHICFPDYSMITASWNSFDEMMPALKARKKFLKKEAKNIGL